MRDPDFTLTAGPTGATPRTLQALGQPIIFDYDPVFLRKFRELERKVGELMSSSADIVLMQGEAVLGLEAAARALTRPGMKALNLVSGVYASWFGDWLREYGADVVEARVPYDEAVDPDAVRQALADNPDVELVAVVQSETPSGIHNPVAEIAPAVKDAGALLLVDAVSALGCEQVLVDDWGIDVCVVGPQKCLAGPPGMSLMSISQAAWEAMRTNPNAPRGSFLSLLDWKDHWVDTDKTKFLYTPSVVDLNGVDSVVDQALEEGLESCIARHQAAARAARAGVKAMGLELYAAQEYAAGCVTAVRVPDGVSRAGALEHIRERYGVMLSGGYGELADKLFRLGHMGPAASSLSPVVAVAARPRARGSRGGGAHRRRGRGHARRHRGSRRTGGHDGVTTLPPFDLHRPGSVDEASRLLEELGDDAVVYSGGTELLLVMKMGFADHSHLVDVKRIDELRRLDTSNGLLEIGAAVTHRELERAAAVRGRWAAFAAMERGVGNLRVRTMGTIGGNLCFADPHSDPATFLLAAGGTVVCRRGGAPPRELSIESFVEGPYRTALQPAELLTAVRVPAPPRDAGVAHEKLSFHERPAVTVSCVADVDDGALAGARVAVGSVGNRPFRASDAEAVLVGAAVDALDGPLAQAVEAAAAQADPVEDANGSVEYKRQLVRVLTARCVRNAVQRAG